MRWLLTYFPFRFVHLFEPRSCHTCSFSFTNFCASLPNIDHVDALLRLGLSLLSTLRSQKRFSAYIAYYRFVVSHHCFGRSCDFIAL